MILYAAMCWLFLLVGCLYCLFDCFGNSGICVYGFVGFCLIVLIYS